MKSRIIEIDGKTYLKVVEVSHGLGMPKTEYAQIMYRTPTADIEWGFISPNGIFLKMEHPIIDGYFEQLPLAADPAFTVKDRIDRFVKHYKAIYDRYTTIIRGK